MKEKKPNKKKEQSAQTKQKLYDSGQRLFAEKDFSTVSVEEITRAAGVTKGTFYVHFESKDALIASFISDYTAGLDLDYKAFLDSLPPDMPASGMLLAMVEKIADVLTGTIGYEILRKIYQMQLIKDVDMETVIGYNRKLYAIFSRLLESGLQRGEFKTDIPLEILSRHFVMAIRGLCYEWCIRYPEFDLKEEIVVHCKMLLQGMRGKSFVTEN